MKVLEVNQITKRFGEFTAVDGCSFSIDEGVIFGLLGPNGAGKTTTIRMIMNIIIPDSGEISVFGTHDLWFYRTQWIREDHNHPNYHEHHHSRFRRNCCIRDK